jgi:hypothetical protein
VEEIEESNTAGPALAAVFELGAWTGRSHAFDGVAYHSGAARAACLKQIHQNRAYENLGLTWERFCERHLGITASYANRIIRRLEQFGKPYFDLLAIAPISADKYPAIAPFVSDQGIEIDGEIVPFLPENAPRIRQFVERARAQVRQAESLLVFASPSEHLTNEPREIVSRFHAWLFDLQSLGALPENKERARQLANYAVYRLRGLFVRQPIPRDRRHRRPRRGGAKN